MKQSYFKLPLSYYRPIAHLSDEQLGRLFRAIYLYQLGSETEVADDIRVAYLFFITRFKEEEARKVCRKSKRHGHGTEIPLAPEEYDRSDRTEVSDKSDPEGLSDEPLSSGNTVVTNAVTHRCVTIRKIHRQPCLSTGKPRIRSPATMHGGQNGPNLSYATSAF